MSIKMRRAMIKNLAFQQQNSKHSAFAKQLTDSLRACQIDISPIAVSRAFNEHYKFMSINTKPHTVRKWLLGQAKPKTETFFLLTDWLKIEPKLLMAKPAEVLTSSNKLSFEFDFTDQEVISKYLSMTIKQKLTVRLLIDAITNQN
jgi:hypothetical protein